MADLLESESSPTGYGMGTEAALNGCIAQADAVLWQNQKDCAHGRGA